MECTSEGLTIPWLAGGKVDRALRAKIQGASDFINGVNLNRLLRHLAGDNYRFRGVSFGSDSTAGGPGLSFEYYAPTELPSARTTGYVPIMGFPWLRTALDN